MKKHLSYYLLLLASIMLVLSACGNEQGEGTEVTETEETDASNTEAPVEEGPYTVVDDRGLDIEFEAVPESVVSLAPSNTEILFALDKGDTVVGVTDYCNYPAEALEIEKVSDSVTVNQEAVLALNPDAIIAYTVGNEESIKAFEDAGIPVFVIESAQTIEDVYGDIEQLAAVMGAEDKGEELNSSIKEQISTVAEKVSTLEEKQPVYFEISPLPEIFTAGSNTFQQEILAAAGVQNIFEDLEGWAKLNQEEIVARNPEVILTTVNYVEDPIGEIKARPSWNEIQAVVNDKVFVLDADVLSRPGPRIGEAVELTAKTVYPELFAQ